MQTGPGKKTFIVYKIKATFDSFYQATLID